MKLVIVDVQLTEEDPEPEAKLDEGEFIVKRIVEIKDLWKTLEGEKWNRRQDEQHIPIWRLVSSSFLGGGISA